MYSFWWQLGETLQIVLSYFTSTLFRLSPDYSPEEICCYVIYSPVSTVVYVMDRPVQSADCSVLRYPESG